MFQTVGLSTSAAVKIVEDFIVQAKEESKREKMDCLPENFGNILLQKEKSDPRTAQFFFKKRSDGVKDEDIKWWWNLHDIERRLLLTIDNWFRIAADLRYRHEDGLSDENAVAELKKAFPMFGEPDSKSDNTDPDRPLPFELKNRINVWITEKANLTYIKEEMLSTSSMNALIRDGIKAGRI